MKVEDKKMNYNRRYAKIFSPEKILTTKKNDAKPKANTEILPETLIIK